MSVLYAFLNSWIDFYENSCVNELDSQWDPVGPSWRCSNRDFEIYDGHFCLQAVAIGYRINN